MKSTAFFLTLALTSHWTACRREAAWIFYSIFGRINISNGSEQSSSRLQPITRVATVAQVITSEPGAKFTRRISTLGGLNISMTWRSVPRQLYYEWNSMSYHKISFRLWSLAVSISETMHIFVEGQIWKKSFGLKFRRLKRGWGCQAARAQTFLQGGGSWGSKFLLLVIWKPCVHISAFVALPRGAAWLWLNTPDCNSHTSGGAALSWALGGPGYPSSPGPFAAVCGPFSPRSLPAFEPQTIHKLECLFPAQWDFWIRFDI